MFGTLRFLMDVVTDYKVMAFLLPSNSYFARQCAKTIPIGNGTEIVLELGGGTGIVTKYLLKQNYKMIIVIEMQSNLVHELKKKFKKYHNVHIVEYNAFHSWQIICDQFSVIQVDHICSTLPILHAQKDQVNGLLNNIQTFLKTGGHFSCISVSNKIYHVVNKHYLSLIHTKKIPYWFVIFFNLVTFQKI